MAVRKIVRSVSNQPPEVWQATTLDKLGKDEKFLEDILAACPELIGLESRRSGIRGPYKIFTQLSLQTPTGRGIVLDIVILASSGHVIVVEVKRHVNPELRDRAVIAQIIDYASSFAALAEHEIVALFGSLTGPQNWGEIVQGHFPEDETCDELAETLLKRMKDGELNLVIACDKIPPGLPDVVAGIAVQNAFGFDLDLVEVAPFVCEISSTAEIIFVPSTRISTEIVSRTAVTVTYREGNAKPSTSVQVTSMEEVEENVREARRGENPNARLWTIEEVEEQFRQFGNPTALDLFEFARRESADGKIIAEGLKVNAVFGFYVKGMDKDRKPVKRMLFNCWVGGESIYLFLNSAAGMASEADLAEFKVRLKNVFPDELDGNRKEAYLSLDAISKHLSEFKDILLWFQKRLASTLPA
ncbi:MAG: hypothetical protein ACKVP0_03180 [Pirellulaceae bacterium]